MRETELHLPLVAPPAPFECSARDPSVSSHFHHPPIVGNRNGVCCRSAGYLSSACALSPPHFFFFNCIEDFKIRIVSCSYPIHCQCLLLPLYPALLLIPWSLAPLLLPLFTQKLCTSQSAMLYRLGKKKKKDCLPCLEVLYREVLDFGTTHELPSSCISPFRGQLRTASKNVQHCRHCFVRDARSKMHMPNLSLIEP